MWRKELLDRLASGRSIEEFFVILWTTYAPRLGEVENGLREAGIQPLRIEAEPATSSRESLETWTNRLARLASDGPKFDETALGLVKGIDTYLKKGFPAEALALAAPIRGLGAELYTINPRNNFIADVYEDIGEGVTWAAEEGRTMFAYARYHRVAPVAGKVGPTGVVVEIRHDWASRHIKARLLESKSKRALKIMLWAFAVGIEYPALAGVGASSWPPFIHLGDPANDGEVLADALRAIDAARKAQATILVFPELSVSAATYDAIRATLAGSGDEDYPVLTIVGLCHRTLESGGVDVNEAVVLGPDGSERHFHRKLYPFTKGKGYLSGERLETGSQISILPSSIGNLAVLICLDLFHPESLASLNDSDANLLLVPSLSPKTTAHETAATQLMATNLCSSFVCNRWLFEISPEPASFFRVPGQNSGKSSSRHVMLFELPRSKN